MREDNLLGAVILTIIFAIIVIGYVWRYGRRGSPSAPGPVMWLGTQRPTPGGAGAIVVREYKGRLPAATRAFDHDAAQMATVGYYPISQRYQRGLLGLADSYVAWLLLGTFAHLFPSSLVVSYQWRPSETHHPDAESATT